MPIVADGCQWYTNLKITISCYAMIMMPHQLLHVCTMVSHYLFSGRHVSFCEHNSIRVLSAELTNKNKSNVSWLTDG